jgi:HPt (histidine-containing phosphotransfer) domain-containing protein
MPSEPAVWAEGVPPEHGRKPSSRPVDLVHLSRYTLGERALEREVLELFCTQAYVYLERLREAQSDKDWKDAAHSLKGSASAIGAWRAAEAAQRAETLSGETLIEARVFRLREIESSLREAETYIGALLKDR